MKWTRGLECRQYIQRVKKVNQSLYMPEVSRGFQEVKVPRLRDNGRGWIYSVCKDKLPNCSCKQIELIFTLWYKWNRIICI